MGVDPLQIAARGQRDAALLRLGRMVGPQDLAHSAATGPVVIRRLLSLLSEAGLTTSQLGAGGGAILAKPSDQIRLLDVYRAVADTDIFTLHRVSPFKVSRCPVARKQRAGPHQVKTSRRYSPRPSSTG